MNTPIPMSPLEAKYFHIPGYCSDTVRIDIHSDTNVDDYNVDDASNNNNNNNNNVITEDESVTLKYVLRILYCAVNFFILTSIIGFMFQIKTYIEVTFDRSNELNERTYDSFILLFYSIIAYIMLKVCKKIPNAMYSK